MEVNSWMLGLAGGLLIGAGASVLLVMNGRIAGISGILGSLVDDPTDSRNGERLSFVVGLLLVPFLYVLVVGVPDLQVKAAIPLVIAGGLLVGFGARGQRLHERAWCLRNVAVVAPVAYCHVGGDLDRSPGGCPQPPPPRLELMKMKNLAAFISGGLFGLGLVVSDMVNPQRVQGFFDIFGAWDPTLVFVIVGANIPMMLSWWWVRRHERSVLGENLPARPSLTIDRRLIGGAVVFGAGWGLVGLCPGTAVASVLFGLPRVLVFVGAMFTGFVAYHHWQVRRRTVVA